MSSKKQSIAAKRQQRQAKKRNNKSATVTKRLGKPTQKQLQRELALNGIVATANKYRNLITNKNSNEEVPDNKEVAMGILKIIEMLAPVHSAIEIANILQEEGNITLTDEDVQAMAEFDEPLVKITEDIMAIQTLMEEGQGFEDFAEIYISCFDNVAEIMHFRSDPILEQILKPNQGLIENYVKEHKEPGESEMTFAFRMHDERMKRVADLYKTVSAPLDIPEFNEQGEEVPQEFIPADDVCDEDFDANIKNVN